MKATELMIGDWVMSEIEGAGRITELGRDWIVALTYGNNSNAVTGELRYLHPVPLTVEILEKNGFEQTGDTTFCITGKGTLFKVNQWSRTFNVEFCRRYEDLPSEQCHLNVCYVHELQRALRLCGMYTQADNFRI